MALFLECMQECAQKCLTRADIVRDAMLQQPSEVSATSVNWRPLRSLAGHKRCSNKKSERLRPPLRMANKRKLRQRRRNDSDAARYRDRLQRASARWVCELTHFR